MLSWTRFGIGSGIGVVLLFGHGEQPFEWDLCSQRLNPDHVVKAPNATF